MLESLVAGVSDFFALGVRASWLLGKGVESLDWVELAIPDLSLASFDTILTLQELFQGDTGDSLLFIEIVRKLVVTLHQHTTDTVRDRFH